MHCYVDGISMTDMIFFFFKQKTAYEMRISDWSSDVCSSDLTKQILLDVGTREMDAVLDDAAQKFAQCVRGSEAPEGIAAFMQKRSPGRSEERRVGKEGVKTCRFRWSTYH